MSPPRFTLAQMMIVIAVVAVELAALPLPVAVMFASLTLGLAGFVTVYRPSPVRVAVAVASGVTLAIGLILPAIEMSRCQGCRRQCPNNLKQIGLALHNYHADYGCLPPAYVADSTGKLLYSWRVLILPFLGEGSLYNSFNLDEPWNGPNNLKLSRTLLSVFSCPDHPGPPLAAYTSYVAVVGPGTAFPGSKSVSFAQVSDGLASTIMVAEVDGTSTGINWAEPRDLDTRTMSFRIDDPTWPSLSGKHHSGPNVVFADGSVGRLDKSLPAATLRALTTIRGGEAVSR